VLNGLEIRNEEEKALLKKITLRRSIISQP